MARIEQARKILSREKVDALLVTDPVDLYYLTGKELSLGRLLIEKKKTTLFVDGRYLEACKALKGIKVISLQDFKLTGVVGFDAITLSYQNYQELTKFGSVLVPLKSPIKAIRAIKEKKEITLLHNAAKLLTEGMEHVLASLCDEIEELEVARLLEMFWLEWGGEGVSFDPIIAFGENAALPHHKPTNRKLKSGDCVLIDIGVTLGKYRSDMTRTVFYGKPNVKLKKIYGIVAEAQAAALKKCKAGAKIKDVVSAAKGVIKKGGFENFFPHSLGHGIGLEVHELPYLKEEGVLEENMVITIEPGIYIPHLGGIRIEDTIAITKKGYQILTDDSSK